MLWSLLTGCGLRRLKQGPQQQLLIPTSRASMLQLRPRQLLLARNMLLWRKRAVQHQRYLPLLLFHLWAQLLLGLM